MFCFVDLNVIANTSVLIEFLGAFDEGLMRKTLEDIKAGKTVHIPEYDFRNCAVYVPTVLPRSWGGVLENG